MPLPDCIRLLDSNEAPLAERVVMGIKPGLYGDEAKLAECTRVVYEGGGLDGDRVGHLRGLAAGAVGIGESKAFISDLVTTGQTGRLPYGRFGALEVDLKRLAEWVESASWEPVRDANGEWSLPLTSDWPEEAVALATPDFVDGWTVTSTNGTWCWVDMLVMEDCRLTAPLAFIAGYKSARPEVVMDPIAYLHSDGSELIASRTTTTRPAEGGWRKLLGRDVKVHHYSESYTEDAKEYFEPMYGVAGARRIWEIYSATARPEPEFSSWEAKVEHFTAVIDADPQMRADLEAIWAGTYAGD